MAARADAEYMRQYRRNNPEAYDLHQRRHLAYRRALLALKEAHPTEFKRLVNRERVALGVPRLGTVKPGPKRKKTAA